MMKKLNAVLWGIVLVAAGVIFALNAVGVLAVDMFFKGWWTLFIIVPCAVGVVTERDRTGSIIGLCLGVLLLLCCRDVIKFKSFWALFVPIVIIIIGIRIIIGALVSPNARKHLPSGAKNRGTTAVFSGSELNFSGEAFAGTDLNAVFGGVDCNLCGALISDDCVINAVAVFGGIDIKVPDGVNVKLNSTGIFGGASVRDGLGCNIDGAPTVYVNATSVFGGVEVK